MTLEEARALRESEKYKYLEANGGLLSDAPARWRLYEDLICDKFLPEGRLAYGDVQRALDEAWIYRERSLLSRVKGKHEKQ